MLPSTTQLPTRRSDLASRMMPTVDRIARQLARRLPRHIRIDDLVGAGCQGLVDALGRFDPSRSEGFESYAETRIRGAMLDELRARDPLSRDQRAAAGRIAAATRTLCARLGRAPDADEIAAEMHVSLATYWEMLAASATDADTSLDGEDGPAPVHVSYADDESADDLLCRRELSEAVARAMEALPPRLRRVLELQNVEELTLREIGDVLGVTESRACQLRTEAVERLRMLCHDHADLTQPASSARPAPHRGPRRRGGAAAVPAIAA